MSDAHSHDDHPAHLAHHFDTLEQQFDTAKMGMWVFLATEILMFGGLFCAYAIYRGNNPEMFMFAHKALDTKWGAINTVVLLASSFTMAWGVRAAQLGQKGLLVGLLILTLMGGAGFMVIKTIEYKAKWDHSYWVGGLNVFHPTNADKKDIEHGVQYIEGKAHGDSHGPAHDDHGASPEPHADTHDEHAPEAGDHGGAEPATAAHAEAPVTVLAAWPPVPADVSKTPPAAAAPAGVSTAFASEYVAPTLEQQLGIPSQAGHAYPRYGELTELERGRTHIFFQIYFLMTGLHGIHVLIGMGLIAWIMFRAMGGVFGPAYYTPVDLVGLYWHLVDLIWIFLFPLLYLIH